MTQPNQAELLPQNLPWRYHNGRLIDCSGRTVADCRYAARQGLRIIEVMNASTTPQPAGDAPMGDSSVGTDEVVSAAMEVGIMLSTAHGQASKKRMPVSDVATLMAFAKQLRQGQQSATPAESPAAIRDAAHDRDLMNTPCDAPLHMRAARQKESIRALKIHTTLVGKPSGGEG